MRTVLNACGVLLILVSMVLAQAPKAVSSIDLADPAGDVREATGKDITKVSLSSDGKSIKAVVLLKNDISKSIHDAMAPGAVLEMYFDTDSKEATGGKSFWGDKKGFEFESQVSGCIEYEGNSSACAGGAGSKVKSLFSVTETKKFTKTGATDTDDIDHFWDLPKGPLAGNRIEGSVEYGKIGVHPGQTIRVVLREADGGFDNASYFPDVHLILK